MNVVLFHFYLGSLRLALHAVQGRHDIGAGRRRLVVRLIGDGYYLRSIVQVDALALVEAIDGIACSLGSPVASLGSRPEEDVAPLHVDGLHLAGLLGCLLADVPHDGLEGGIAPIDLAQRSWGRF